MMLVRLPAFLIAGEWRKHMKKLILVAATLTLAVSTSPNLISQSKAAQSRSAYCNMAKSQKDPVSWNARYGCLDTSKERVAARAEATPPAGSKKNPYCNMAKSQKDPVSWNARYGCLNR
jgi:hypothetical protein